MNNVSKDLLRAENFPAKQDTSALTGLELMQKLCDGHLPVSPLCKELGFDMVEVEHGVVVFKGRPALNYYNVIGCVHGGWIATLLDSCMGYAVYTTIDEGVDCRTLELKVNYVRGVLADTGTLRAEGHVLHRGRRTATAEGRLLDENGKLYAHGTTTCLII